MGYIDSLKAKVNDATYYTPEFKSQFCSEVDSLIQTDPVVFLRELADYMNGLLIGVNGDKALYRCKGLIHFLKGTANLYEQLITNQTFTDEEKATLITGLIEQKGTAGRDGKWAF